MAKNSKKEGCEKFDEVVKAPPGIDPIDLEAKIGETFGSVPLVEPAERCHPEIVEEARQLSAALGLSNVKTYIVDSTARNAIRAQENGAPDTERDIYLPSIAIDNGSQQWKYYLASQLARSSGANIPPALVPNEIERKEIRDTIIKAIRQAGLIKEHKINEVADERLLNLEFDLVSAGLASPRVALDALSAEQQDTVNAMNQLNRTKNARASGMPDASYGGPAPDPNKPVRPMDTYRATPAVTEEAFYDDPRYEDPMKPSGPSVTAPYDLRKAFVQKYGKEVSPTELAAGAHVTPIATPTSMASSQNPDTPPKKPDNKPQR